MSELPEEYLNLPLPDVIEELDYTVLRDQIIAEVEAEFATIGLTYDVGALETDPVVIQAEVYAGREQRLRQRINEAMRAYMVPFSSQADLDMLASFYGVTRLEDETDKALRHRVVLAIKGRSTAGPRHWYEFQALTADVRVREALASGLHNTHNVYLNILSTEEGGVASQDLIDTVQAAIDADAVRVISDNVTVRAAVQQEVDVTAKIYLLEGVGITVFNSLEATLQTLWNDRQRLGLDMTRSWLVHALHQAGVQNVDLTAPVADVTVDSDEAIALGTITLTFEGYRT